MCGVASGSIIKGNLQLEEDENEARERKLYIGLKIQLNSIQETHCDAMGVHERRRKPSASSPSSPFEKYK